MLADFGIARRVGESSTLTGTNMTVGTVAYAAPEQLKGEDDRRSRRPVRAGGHGLPAVDRHPAVPPFQSRGRDQPASDLRSAAIGARRPELSGLGPVFDKASGEIAVTIATTGASISPAHLATGRYRRARGRRERDHGRPFAATGPRHAAKAEATSRRRTVLARRRRVGRAVVVATIAFVVFDRSRSHPPRPSPRPPGRRRHRPASPAPVLLPVVVVGADCATLGRRASPKRAPAYCAHLSDDEHDLVAVCRRVASPTVTARPEDEVYPSEPSRRC